MSVSESVSVSAAEERRISPGQVISTHKKNDIIDD